MENLLLITFSGWMITGLCIGGIGMFILVFGILCYKVLAPKNIFFTFGRENRAMNVMVGKKFTGKVILPSKTMCFDKNYDFRQQKDLPNFKKQNSFWGMYWIGIYPFYSIYERRQQWLEWQSDKEGKRIIVSRDEMTPYLMVNPFEYTMLLEGGEDFKGVPLNVYFTVILQAHNATKPTFGNENAYGQVQTLCRGEVLLFVKEKTFSNLGGGNATSNITHDEFSEILCKLNKEIPGRPDKLGLIEVLGYEIKDAKLDSVEIVGDQKEKLLEASTAKYIAEEMANAEIAKAEGEKQATIIRAQGNKIAGELGIDVEKYSMEIRNDFYEKIKDKPYAQQIELAKKMFEDSNLTTFVSGKDVTPNIPLK
jgi:hypothetical protein